MATIWCLKTVNYLKVRLKSNIDQSNSFSNVIIYQKGPVQILQKILILNRIQLTCSRWLKIVTRLDYHYVQ